jgi:hypothetical protein
MLLVSAFLGKENNVTKIYQEAQNRGYRFLSYGDSCLFSKVGAQLPSEGEIFIRNQLHFSFKK